MGEELTIRRYEPGDTVWPVHERAFRASSMEFVEDAPADADLRDVSGEYLDGGGEFLVGEVGGEIVAIGGFRPSDDAAELRRMRVHPDHQRRGYGERLLSELEARAAERGFERAVLETHEDLTAARGLYEKHGYERVDTDADSLNHLVRYRKPL